MSYGTLISTVTVGAGGAASIDFTSIPGTFTDLVLVASVRDTTPATNGAAMNFYINYNGTTINSKSLRGNGASVVSLNGGSTAPATRPYSTSGGDTANTFGNAVFYIPNYTASIVHSYSADFVTENNATTAYAGIIAGLRDGTAAPVNSVALSPYLTLFAQYSSASLYGILKGSGGASVTP